MSQTHLPQPFGLSLSKPGCSLRAALRQAQGERVSLRYRASQAILLKYLVQILVPSAEGACAEALDRWRPLPAPHTDALTPAPSHRRPKPRAHPRRDRHGQCAPESHTPGAHHHPRAACVCSQGPEQCQKHQRRTCHRIQQAAGRRHHGNSQRQCGPPTAKLAAEVRAACTGRAASAGDTCSSSRAWAPSASCAMSCTDTC